MVTIFTIWIAILPVITWHNRYEVPKVSWLLAGGLLALLYLLINFKKIIFTKKDYFYLGWLLILLISSLLSENVKLAILGGSYRHQGIVFFFCLWVLNKVVSLFNKKEKDSLYRGVGLTVIAEAILVLVGHRLGTLGDINAVSGFIAIGIYFTFNYLPKWLSIIPIFAFLYNFSKSATLSLVPYLFKKINIIFILLVLIASFIIKPIDNTSLFENREVIWRHSISLIADRPIIGYGAESNEKIFKKAFSESGFPLVNLIIDRTHNLFLDITMWSGMLGLILFLSFLFHSFNETEKRLKNVFIAFLIYSMFQPLSVAHWILLMIII